MAGTQYQGVQVIGVKTAALAEGTDPDYTSLGWQVSWLHPHVSVEPQLFPDIMTTGFGISFQATKTETNAEDYQARILYEVTRTPLETRSRVGTNK